MTTAARRGTTPSLPPPHPTRTTITSTASFRPTTGTGLGG
ncbi:hypothetical protein G647_06655 [Cladophialophora carrionii CBS 160.54]|uniref:Uncharacterized protein n=1 Tax=Cladophialophora carrionii CBS 160.54 TaxID=1279043 RepID=V9D6P0_9EURO|nr:uncharacterized protein G647_06655 [Cladophialophora carrionii CBS 160.54]ETI22579.1 hypothetical protein G647_06655 [Cladophialophora carrionii CBS 160.54]